MSVTIEHNKGIRLDLTSYHRIRTYQGGGEFWEHENQQILRQYLGEFLPTAVPEEGGVANTVLYSHLEMGHEVLSRSAGLDSGHAVPSAQLERLREAVGRLKERENDATIDADARKLIQFFRLPDPQKDPHLYRILPNSNRLLVLWGVERDRDSSLPPTEVVGTLTGSGAGGSSGSKKGLLVFALLLLVAAAGALWYFKYRQPEAPGPVAVSATPTPAAGTPSTGGLAGSGSGAETSPGNGGTPNGQGGDFSPAEPGAAHPTLIASGAPTPTKEHRDGGKRNAGQHGETEAGGQHVVVVEHGGPAQPAVVTPVDPHTPGGQASPVTPGGARDQEAKGPTAKAPKDLTAKDKGKDPSKPETPTAKAGETPEKDHHDVTPHSPVAAPGDTTLVVIKEGDPRMPHADPAGGYGHGSTPVTPAATDDTRLEISKYEAGDGFKDGKLDITLSAFGRNGANQRLPINSVSSWEIDGVVQKDAKNQLVTGTTLPVQLGEGKHRCVVHGMNADGKPIEAVAEVRVNATKQVTEKVVPTVEVVPGQSTPAGK